MVDETERAPGGAGGHAELADFEVRNLAARRALPDFGTMTFDD